MYSSSVWIEGEGGTKHNGKEENRNGVDGNNRPF